MENLYYQKNDLGIPGSHRCIVILAKLNKVDQNNNDNHVPGCDRLPSHTTLASSNAITWNNCIVQLFLQTLLRPPVLQSCRSISKPLKVCLLLLSNTWKVLALNYRTWSGSYCTVVMRGAVHSSCPAVTLLLPRTIHYLLNTSV